MKKLGLPRLADLPAYLAGLWAFAVLVWAHLFFMKPPAILHGLDEGYVNAFCWRMTEGKWLPFVDGVSHRGPLMYWMVAIAIKLSTPLSWMPLRVVSMLVGVGTLVFTFLAGWRARKPLAGAVGAVSIIIVYLLAMMPIDGLAYSGEHAANVFIMAALFTLTAALDKNKPAPSLPLVITAGALGALGVLSKQVAAASLVPLGLWVLAAATTRPNLAKRDRWKLVLGFGLGVAVPVLVTVIRYASEGELKTLIYYTFTYNSEVYLGPYTRQAKIDVLVGWSANNGVLLGILAAVSLWAITRPLAAAPKLRQLPRAWDEHGFVATVGVGALLASLASNSPLRGFIHYYLAVVPWCGLLLGLVVERALETRHTLAPHRDAVIRALVLAPMVVVAAMGVGTRFSGFARDRAKGGFGDMHGSPICKYVQAHSGPKDTLFVWGFLPEIYTACERKPATRYVLTTFISGFVPWFDKATKAEDDARAVPGSRDIVLRELEESKPPIIIDAPKSLGNRPMKRYEVLARYLDQHYCAAGPQAGFDIYLRKGDGGACPKGSK